MSRIRNALLVGALGLVAGCADLGGLAGSLGDAIARQPDPGVVRDGAPAYLIMADTFAERAPRDADTQLAAARLDPASLLADIRAVAEERTRQRQLHA